MVAPNQKPIQNQNQTTSPRVSVTGRWINAYARHLECLAPYPNALLGAALCSVAACQGCLPVEA